MGYSELKKVRHGKDSICKAIGLMGKNVALQTRECISSPSLKAQDAPQPPGIYSPLASWAPAGNCPGLREKPHMMAFQQAPWGDAPWRHQPREETQ